MTTGRRSLTAPPPTTTPPPAAAPVEDRRATHASAPVVAAALVCGVVLLVALLVAGGRPAPSVPGLPDAGPVTGWALPAARLVFDLTAVTTVGALLLAAVLLPAPATRLPDVAISAVRSASWSAGLWSVSALLLWVLTASETTGVPLAGLTTQDLREQAAVGQGRALLVVALLGGAVAAGCARVGTTPGGRRLLVLAGLGLLPTTVTGHAASAADHELAVSTLVVHVVAATVWAGGLLAVVLFLRRPSELAAAVRRFSVVALACFVLVALSGLLSAYERLGLTAAAWTSGYGALVLGKTAALVVLGAMGWEHRRRLVPALAAGRPGAFLSFAGVELSVLGGAIGLAVALSRTPTPATTATAAPVASHGAGHETLPTTLDPVSLSGLVLEWRINAVVLAVAALLAVAYAAGVRRLRSGTTPWSGARSAAFAGGLAVAVVALSGGVATYAAAMLSVQVAQFVLLLVVVPALLALGAPLDLLQRVRAADGASPADREPVPPHSPLAVLTDPLAGMLLVAGLVFAVYRTGLLGRALGSSMLFLAVNTAALAVGCLLVWPALGSDPRAALRSTADRVAPLLAAAATLLLLAAELWFSEQVAARRWFAALGWSWVDPAADQRLAALLAAAGAVLLLALAAAARRPVPLVPPCPEAKAQPARTADQRTG